MEDYKTIISLSADSLSMHWYTSHGNIPLNSGVITEPGPVNVALQHMIWEQLILEGHELLSIINVLYARTVIR